MLHFPKWKTFLVLLICFISVLFFLPNVINIKEGSFLSKIMPTSKVNLGLDLRGGHNFFLKLILMLT
mgnify:CR=1 FL=1